MTAPIVAPPGLDWLTGFPYHDGWYEIAPTRAFAHDEATYDEKFHLARVNPAIGGGAVKLLQERGCDFSGPALEIGCGTGLLTLGLVATDAYPAVLVSDPSPEFLRITARKLAALQPGCAGRVAFASLTGESLGRLPAGAFSAVILRSVLHHVIDVEQFIAEAARVLRPGGALLCEEPCGEGFMLMAALAQFIPVVMAQAGRPLSPEQAKQIEFFLETMRYYLRRDVDKSAAEDKHVFRADELTAAGLRHGFQLETYANAKYPQFLHQAPEEQGRIDAYVFMKHYLQNCMSFGPEMVQHFDEAFAPYMRFIREASAGWSGPHFKAVFLWRKSPPEAVPAVSIVTP